MIKISEQLVEENFKGLSDFIKDKDILHWYKTLIAVCIEDYHSQFLAEGDAVEKEPDWKWTDELVKEMIYSKLPIPDHYIANVQKCLDEFKEYKNKSDKDPFENFEEQAIKENIEWHGRLEEFEGEKEQ